MSTITATARETALLAATAARDTITKDLEQADLALVSAVFQLCGMLRIDSFDTADLEGAMVRARVAVVDALTRTTDFTTANALVTLAEHLGAVYRYLDEL